MSELDAHGYESTEVSPREIIDLLRRRRWTVLGTFVLCVVLGGILTKKMTPQYRARATMLLEQSPVGLAGADEDGPLRGSLQLEQAPDVETQVEVLNSGPLLAKVIQRIGAITTKASPRISVAQVGHTDVVEVIGESTRPEVARDAANTLIDEYIEETDQNETASIRRARIFVQHKLDEAQARLVSTDARLRAFKEQNHLPDLTSDLANAIAAASTVGEELRKSENELISLKGQIQQARQQLAREPLTVKGSQTISPNPDIDSLQSEIQKLELQRISLSRTLKPTEPEVREVEAQIAELRLRQRKLPRNVVSGVTWQPNPQRGALQAQVEALETQLRGRQPQVQRLRHQSQLAENQLRTYPAWETTLSQLQRERDWAQGNEKALSDRLQSLRIREEARRVAARPLTQAPLPAAPVRPQPAMNFLVASALGLVFGIGVSCLQEMIDDRIHTAEDGERVAGLPILGRVPMCPRRAGMLISAHGGSPAKESYRRLRARISFAADVKPVRSLMITSAVRGEGKSTTAANLAVTAALEGRRVILVDADLRAPSLSALLRIGPVPGLSDVLTGAVPVSSALHATQVPDLLLLPAGSAVPDAAELLAGPRMGDLVRELSAMADLVLVDTPPCLPVADAELLGSFVDAALLVVGIGRARKEGVRTARELLDQARVRLLGAVINRMKPNDGGYYSDYRPRSRTPLARLRAAAPVVGAREPDAVFPVHGDKEEHPA